ncbi:MAG: OFA family MFS transporter [Clostridiales bacterium]|nr:OFA family MFS transporter [Clostridiales bacterium]
MKNLNRGFYAAAGVVVLLFAGLIYAWSVMSKSIAAARPTWNAAQLSVTFTLVMAFFCIGGLVAGTLSKRISARLYVLFGGIIIAAGFWIASKTGSSPTLLYLGFGVICGLGAGLIYNAVISTVSLWFPDKPGFISGILLMGFGFGSFIIGKVYTAITPSDGTDTWQVSFRFLGVAVLIVMVICSPFFVKPQSEWHPGEKSESQRAARQTVCEVFPRQMIKMPTFWIYYIWTVLVGAAGLVLVSQASGIATQARSSVPDGLLATVVGLISIFNGVGRVVFGELYDKKGYRFTMTGNMVFFIVAEVVLLLALISGMFLLICVGFVFGGFANGGVTPTNSALIAEFFGRKNYAMNFSLVNTSLLVSSFASVIAGKLYDISGSYAVTIIMMLIVTAVAFAVSAGVRRPKNSENGMKP